ncbi:energy transducer TonB [Algoriphagus formosus]|uniref:energy transducer TonB n=1 Tax=Algoriphagus formosus TaxID=2007308 RepID=UPI000C286BA3|nr:energy transducer TonB [Algoriphagus formosus]
METKKNPNADLRKWSTPLFYFGLTCSLGICLTAFEWKSYPEGKLKEITSQTDIWEIPEVPISIQTPPPPPETAPPIVTEVPNDITIDPQDFNIDINMGEDVEIPTVVLPNTPPTVDKADEILDFTEVQATFKGGMEKWTAYLKENLTYPSQARRMGIEGVVLVRFVVNKDGSVQDAEVVRSLGGGCDEIALKVVANSPEWNPGKVGGNAVRSRMVIPIRFRLN